MTGSWFLDHLWLVPLLPFLGFLLIALVLRPLASPRVCVGAAIAAVSGSAIVGWGAAFAYFAHHAGETLVPWQTTWLAFTPTFAGQVGVLVDNLSLLLVMVVTRVSLLVHIYSTGYMHGEHGLPALLRLPEPLHLLDARAGALDLDPADLRLLGAGRRQLVPADRLLLGKPCAVAACKKAFIVTRFADLGFLLGC